MCFCRVGRGQGKAGAETDAAAEQCILDQANVYGDVHDEHALEKLRNDCAVAHSRVAEQISRSAVQFRFAVKHCKLARQYENVDECSETLAQYKDTDKALRSLLMAFRKFPQHWDIAWRGVLGVVQR